MKNYATKSFFLIIYFFNTLICAFVSYFKHSNNYFLESDFWFSYFLVLLITLSIYKDIFKVIHNVVFITLGSIPFILFSMLKSIYIKGLSFNSIQTQSYFLVSIIFVLALTLFIFNKKILEFRDEILVYFKNIKNDKKLIFLQFFIFIFTLFTIQFLFN